MLKYNHKNSNDLENDNGKYQESLENGNVCTWREENEKWKELKWRGRVSLSHVFILFRYLNSSIGVVCVILILNYIVYIVRFIINVAIKFKRFSFDK